MSILLYRGGAPSRRSPFLFVLMTVAICLGLAAPRLSSVLAQSFHPLRSVGAPAAALLHSDKPLTSSSQPSSATTSTASAQKNTLPKCQPQNFDTPDNLSLSNRPDGLTVQADTPVYYTIYGSTAAQLRAQIMRCAPGASASTAAEFTADTSYNMTWQYYTTIQADGSCKLNDIKVGVHTATIMPFWQPTASAANGLPGRWQSFTSDLLRHEQGHAALDAQYAAKVVSDLNALPAMNCGDLSQTVQSTINLDVSALNNANNNYDAATDHGATQGAVIPSY